MMSIKNFIRQNEISSIFNIKESHFFAKINITSEVKVRLRDEMFQVLYMNNYFQDIIFSLLTFEDITFCLSLDI